MTTRIWLGLGFLAGPGFGAGTLSGAENPPVRALLVTGGCCHNYTLQTEAIREAVGESTKVAWTVILEKIQFELDNATALKARYAAILPGDTTLGTLVDVVTEVRDALQAVRPI